MNELSLYILDLVENSVAASARRVTVAVEYPDGADEIVISIEDDGRGMDEELLKRVASPFATTRKTRKVGLGIPMARQMCEDCGGSFEITSAPGAGTKLKMTMKRSHIDLPPMGDLPGTFVTLVTGCPETPEFLLRYARGQSAIVFDTAEVREALGGVPLNRPEVLSWIGEYIRESIMAVDSGRDQI
jgi:anti-sigma regulatory factor (Ser/Thr protein kinase)